MRWLLLSILSWGNLAGAGLVFGCEERLDNPAPPELGLVLPDVDARLRRIVDESLRPGLDFGIARAAAVKPGVRLRDADERSLAMFEKAVAGEVAALTTFLDVVAARTRAVNAEIDARRGVLASYRPAGEPESLHEIFGAFIRLANAYDVQNLIRAIRIEDRDALTSPEVQLALQRITFGGIGFAAHQVVWYFAHPLGWAHEPVKWTEVLGRERCDVRPSAVDAKLCTSTMMMQQLVRELLSNAERAADHRHGIRGVEFVPIVRFEERDRVVALSIEDFGSPESYTHARGTGVSLSSVDGVGIGRLRAHLFATFLGYAIERKIKEDRSGSILSILIPRSHLVIADARGRSRRAGVSR